MNFSLLKTLAHGSSLSPTLLCNAIWFLALLCNAILCNAIWRVGRPRPTKCHTLSSKTLTMHRIVSICCLCYGEGAIASHFLFTYLSLSNMNNFKIQPYTKKELALLYFPSADPHVAVNRLMMWIKRQPELHHTLVEQGYKKNVRWLSAREVGTIVRWLGEP